MNKEKVMSIIGKIVLYNVLIGAFILFAFSYFCTNNEDDEYVLDVYRNNIELHYYSAKDSLVRCIDSYIAIQAPNSCMNGIAFIEASEEHDINPFFIVAQCQLESNFATTGLGRKTNSAFNICAYDGMGDKYMTKYKHPDLSIHPYINVLKNSYLVNGITEFDLMHKYVNADGKRYASDPNYENKLYSIYNKLSTEYGDIYGYFLKMKTLSGK